MKTSKEWYREVKNNGDKFTNWLINQYHGEVTAAERMHSILLSFPCTDNQRKTVELIVSQEVRHAEWIKGLLEARGIKAEVLNKKERYWDETLKQITDWDTGCAVAAHAEAMRLERIRVICEDEETQSDIREVFLKILKEEEFHAKAFLSFTTDNAMLKTLNGHLAGLNELGLTI